MKLTQFNTKIFVQELETLVEDISKVTKAAETWLKDQENRTSVNQYTIQAHRQRLEEELNTLRYRLATVYDFQGDRGMVDFLVGSITNGHVKEEEEEEIEYDALDYETLKYLSGLCVSCNRPFMCYASETCPCRNGNDGIPNIKAIALVP